MSVNSKLQTSNSRLSNPPHIAELLPVFREISFRGGLLLRRFANIRPDQDVSYECGAKRHHKPLHSPNNCFSERSEYNRH